MKKEQMSFAENFKDKTHKLFAISCLGLSLLPIANMTTKTAWAIGYNPAMEKQNTQKYISAKHQQWILFNVDKELSEVIPQSPKTYQATALHKMLSTNFAHKGFPSEVKTTNGYDENGNLKMNSLKQPLTQPKKMVLADLCRYYYFSFTPQEKFTPIDSKDAEDIQLETIDNKSQKLNYFDYIKLINLIKDNPNLSDSQRQKKLISIETDIQNSIQALYGYKNSNNQNSNSNNLNAWGGNKTVTIPFNSNNYTYLQLLAAYKKTGQVNDVLAFYNSIFDTLAAIKQYAVEVRQGDTNATININKYTNELNTSYNKVDKSLIQPMIEVERQQLSQQDANKKAAQWQTNQLGNLGLTDKNQTEGISDDDSDSDTSN